MDAAAADSSSRVMHVPDARDYVHDIRCQLTFAAMEASRLLVRRQIRRNGGLRSLGLRLQ